MTTETTPITMAELETGSRVYATARAELGEAIAAMNADLDAVKRKHRASLTAALDAYRTAEAKLRADVEAAPSSMFKKPRTYTLHGVKVGRQLSKPVLKLVRKEAEVIALIRKHMPEREETLVRTVEELIKPAAANLEAKELARIGCQLTAAVDTVVLKAVNTDIDKLIKALLGDESDDEVQA